MTGPWRTPNPGNNWKAISDMEYDRMSPPGSEVVDEDFDRDYTPQEIEAIEKSEASNEHNGTSEVLE